jgi:hypothetical protein
MLSEEELSGWEEAFDQDGLGVYRPRADKTKPMVTRVAPMMFQVYQQGRSARRNNATYGAHLDKGQALLDAIDAARDAREEGCEAHDHG